MILNKTLFLSLIVLLPAGLLAQSKLFSKEAGVSFFSKTALENIEAQNNKGLCVWDIGTGQFEFLVLIKGFQFDRALMQEHFNENYMESDKYPKAGFKGNIMVDKKLLLQPNIKFQAQVSGLLTIHGVSKQISITANIKISNGIISLQAVFNVNPADYRITIPAIVADKINKNISINVSVPEFKKL